MSNYYLDSAYFHSIACPREWEIQKVPYRKDGGKIRTPETISVQLSMWSIDPKKMK